jgi:hypothetical protein
LTHGFRDFGPLSTGSIALRPVARQKFMAESRVEESSYLMVTRK